MFGTLAAHRHGYNHPINAVQRVRYLAWAPPKISSQEFQTIFDSSILPYFRKFSYELPDVTEVHDGSIRSTTSRVFALMGGSWIHDHELVEGGYTLEEIATGCPDHASRYAPLTLDDNAFPISFDYAIVVPVGRRQL